MDPKTKKKVLTFQHDIRTFWFSLMMITPKGVNWIHEFFGVDISEFLVVVGWVCLEVYLACKRSTREEHVWSTQIARFSLRENRAGRKKIARGCVEVGLWSNSTYRLQWYLPWKWGISMAMFVYRRVRQARIPLHLEGEHGGGFKTFFYFHP